MLSCSDYGATYFNATVASNAAAPNGTYAKKVKDKLNKMAGNF
jgi:hypothetical protein